MAEFGHFLQSRDWEKYEQLEGETTFWREGKGWHALALLKQTPLGNYLYLPYGPALADASSLQSALEELKNSPKNNRHSLFELNQRYLCITRVIKMKVIYLVITRVKST